MEELFYITGAPGSGKTTLLESLSKNYETVKEAAREVLSSQDQDLWSEDREKFLDLICEFTTKAFDEAKEGRPVFFDRGLPDIVSYAEYGGINSDKYKAF